MIVVLHRSNLSLTSGAGQLIRMQAAGLRAAGEKVRVKCRNGSLKFFLRTRLPVTRVAKDELRRLAASSNHLVVDHGMDLPEADLIFVHNLMTEAVRYLKRADWIERAAEEAAFFSALRPEAPIVANSELVRRSLIEHFGLCPDRIVVHYPGIDTSRFGPRLSGADSTVESLAHPLEYQTAFNYRRRAREALGVTEGVPLVGFITSGDFQKRGLDIFLETAELIAEARANVRFLVVGSKHLPEWAALHPLVANGRVLYRPKSRCPERWFAALDVFLYPAHFEEFGMVVAEALASGLPVLTSRRVGAAECLPSDYRSWVIDEPESRAFANNTLRLLEDDEVCAQLAAAGVERVAMFDREHYVRATLEMIRDCARRKARGEEVAPCRPG